MLDSLKLSGPYSYLIEVRSIDFRLISQVYQPHSYHIALRDAALQIALSLPTRTRTRAAVLRCQLEHVQAGAYGTILHHRDPLLLQASDASRSVSRSHTTIGLLLIVVEPERMTAWSQPAAVPPGPAVTVPGPACTVQIECTSPRRHVDSTGPESPTAGPTSVPPDCPAPWALRNVRPAPSP
jgi:hypothetical protein